MNILGINAYHADVSAVLLKDGKLVVAVEEERFRRVKHVAGFPEESIRKCLEMGGISAAEIDRFAVSRDPKANLGRKAWYVLTHRPSLGMVRRRGRNQAQVGRLPETIADRLKLDRERVRERFHWVEHHPAHLASAFFVSPFDVAAVCAIDGFGDFVSTSFAVGRERHLELLERVYFPHSLGIFYLALTQYLGFPDYGEEFKVMGLAPYGAPDFKNELRRLVRLKPGGLFELDLSYFRHWSKGETMTFSGGVPRIGPVYSAKLEELLGPARKPEDPLEPRHESLAASLQAVLEEAVFHVLEELYRKTHLTSLCLAGGCAMNSVANGKIRTRSRFENLYVQPAAADNGTALGAAFHVWSQLLKQPRRFVMKHALWGPEFEDGDVEECLRQSGIVGQAAAEEPVVEERAAEEEPAGREVPARRGKGDSSQLRFDWGGEDVMQDSSLQPQAGSLRHVRVERIEEEERLCARTARAISEGKVVGWFQGRMEWGARALGNRSIVADPRRPDMRDIINSKIKFRAKFRPFAPSILEEAVHEYFVGGVSDPFMIQVYPVREDKRDVIPAVTHVDGSGRLQTVGRDQNPRYWKLIKAFEDLTGVPVVLNTSFNENEPIVHRPEEALDCFLRTDMGVLVMGTYFIEKAH